MLFQTLPNLHQRLSNLPPFQCFFLHLFFVVRPRVFAQFHHCYQSHRVVAICFSKKAHSPLLATQIQFISPPTSVTFNDEEEEDNDVMIAIEIHLFQTFNFRNDFFEVQNLGNFIRDRLPQYAMYSKGIWFNEVMAYFIHV